MSNAAKRINTHVIEEIVAELIRVEHFRGGSVVSTPIMYPSGSFAIVQVKEIGARYFVTDLGLGMQEAEMMGVPIAYRRIARLVAESAGVHFDSNAFFETEVTIDDLASAVAIIANCSSEAAKIAAYNIATDKEDDEAATDALYEKLTGIFPKDRVKKHITLRGSSRHEWKVATIVEGSGAPSIFEPVKNHASSIYAVATKFQDIARLTPTPRRVSVVHNPKELETYLGVLSQAGEVIDDQASPEIYRKLVAA